MPESWQGQRHNVLWRRMSRWLLIIISLRLTSAIAQTDITQNNLLQNGGFDSGGAGWSTSANAVYFYNDGAENILSIGWTNGAGFWQTSGATIVPGVDYVLTIRAKVAQAPVTGLSLSVQDASDNWVWLTNQDFVFPNQTDAWRVFSLYVSSNTLAGAVGHTMAVGTVLNESPGSQMGWLWVDWMQLAPAVPEVVSQAQTITNCVGNSLTLSATFVGAITDDSGPGSVLQYQWYETPANLLPGATNGSLFFPALELTDAGNYFAAATGPFGSIQSSNIALIILPSAGLPTSVAVDLNQQIVNNFDGWGTSLCWWANVCGGYTNRATYAAMAFTDLGLNIVRYNIGGGENPGLNNTMEFRAQMQGFEPTNGVWNWNADANQRWMLRQAVSLGANHVVAFANSPPWWMTVSGSVTGFTNGAGNNLLTNYESSFTGYLTTVVSNLTILDGVKFDLVTPMNEPTAAWWVYGGRQEGCHMDASQQNRVVNSLRTNLDAAGLSAGIDASEDNDEQDTINSVSSYDFAGKSNVTVVASHTYGANNASGLKDAGAALGRPLWISEYGDGDASGLIMARRIHDDITQTGARAWVYWQVVDNAGGWGCLYNPEDGSGNSALTVNKKFYVLWQFSHFIRPGCQIVSANDTNSLAAYDSTNHNLIIVALNDSTNSLNYSYNLGPFVSAGSQAVRWRTSANESGNPLPAITVSNSQFANFLAPQSVTTLVVSNVIINPPQPLAWYPFEGNALDVSGNGNNAMLATNVSYVTGKIGAFAAQFNGKTNSYVMIPRCISNSLTVTCWIKTTNSAGTGQWWAGQGIVDGEVQGTTNDFGLSLVGRYAGFGIGNPDTTIVSTNAINDGQWHHLAATWDGSSGQMQLYVDGGLQASTAGPAGTRTAPPSLRIGSIQPGYAGGFLAGAIDDVQLFNQVLSAPQVIQTMNHPPILAPVAASTIMAGQTLLITNLASDASLPAVTLSWSLQSAPTNASVYSVNQTNGIIVWRPTIVQSPSSNTFKLIVADNGTPQSGATQNVSVTVLQPLPPQLQKPGWADRGFTLTVNGNSGPDYYVETTTNLNEQTIWTPLVTNLSATMPWAWTDFSASNQPLKFYRVRLGP